MRKDTRELINLLQRDTDRSMKTEIDGVVNLPYVGLVKIKESTSPLDLIEQIHKNGYLRGVEHGKTLKINE
jgi:hypothetical protein